MSRHVIVNTDDRVVVVGWDAPLGTFFAQEYDVHVKEEEDDLLWWTGNLPREIETIDQLSERLRVRGAYTIPNEVWMQLAGEEAKPWTPGPVQAAFGFLGKETP